MTNLDPPPATPAGLQQSVATTQRQLTTLAEQLSELNETHAGLPIPEITAVLEKAQESLQVLLNDSTE